MLGSPVAHSLSPALHRAGYAAAGLTGWTYGRYEVTAGRLPGFVSGLGPRWVGLSLTMPLKEAALDLAARASATAEQVGAANTLLRADDGSWAADNTDVHGIGEALRPHLPAGRTPRSATVLGSGATARSALAALAGLGVEQVVLVVRDRARPQTLALADALGLAVDIAAFGQERAPQRWAAADLVVSTLPPEASTSSAASLPEGPSPDGQVVLDVVYAGWPTPFARAAAARGAHVVGGLDMLVHQAAAQLTLMTGRPAPVAPMLDAGRAALGLPAG